MSPEASSVTFWVVLEDAGVRAGRSWGFLVTLFLSVLGVSEAFQRVVLHHELAHLAGTSSP
jgi:hypothetical protein